MTHKVVGVLVRGDPYILAKGTQLNLHVAGGASQWGMPRILVVPWRGVSSAKSQAQPLLERRHPTPGHAPQPSSPEQVPGKNTCHPVCIEVFRPPTHHRSLPTNAKNTGCLTDKSAVFPFQFAARQPPVQSIITGTSAMSRSATALAAAAAVSSGNVYEKSQSRVPVPSTSSASPPLLRGRVGSMLPLDVSSSSSSENSTVMSIT